MLGQTFSHYLILEKLGEGGMGVVYKCRDTRLNRLVALKVLPSDKVFNPDRKRRFMNEARAASALNHPNIITIYDVGSEAGVDFIAMEFVAGRSLDRLIAEQGMALAEVLRVSIQIADALAKAHTAGIIHRDLKPANIMITEDGLVKILDFGLAKLTEVSDVINATQSFGGARTEAGAILGTVAYMSPEQAQGKNLDTRSDVFSFGSVLYEMVTRRKAFAADSGISTLTAILRDEPQPVKGVPAELERLLQRLLRKDPARRFQHMADVKVALEDVAADVTRPVGRARDQEQVPPSIAVLPFANLSADKENEYFSDGLAEEIINALTKIPGLRVTARTSAFAFRGREHDLRGIGEALGVEHVLQGSVRRSANRIRVAVQLIKVVDACHLWSERYDREMTDVFAIQDDISQAIVESLKVKLAGAAQPLRRPENLEAYHACLRGRYHFYKYAAEALAKSKECFAQAIALQPDYATPYAGLADYYYFLAVGGWADPIPALSMARATAEKALELDPALPEAHAVLATVYGGFDYDWEKAEMECRLALESENAAGIARYRCALNVLLPLGRHEEAVWQLREALRQDPLALLLHFGLGYVLHMVGQCDEAVRCFGKAFEVDPRFWLIHFGLGACHLFRGKLQESLPHLQAAFEMNPRTPWVAGTLAHALAQAGKLSDARNLVAPFADPGKPGYSAFAVAILHVSLGETDQAFQALERAIEDREPNMTRIALEPLFNSIRQDPRFEALLRKMRLPVAK